MSRPLPNRITAAWLIGIVIAATLLHRAGEANELSSEITIDDALRILQSESPRWAAERAQLSLAEAEIIAASVLSNPTLSYNLLQLGQVANTGAASTHQVTLEQPLLLFGQRGKRIEAAQAAQRALRADLSARFAERARDLHRVFVDLLGAQEKQRLLHDSLQEMQRAEAIVRGRAAAGDRSQYDVLRIALESRALANELATVEAERLEAAGQLGQLLGKPGWQPRARGDLTPIDPTQTADVLWERARARHPAIVAAQRRIEQAEAVVSQARRERAPEIAVQLGLMATQAEDSLSAFIGLSTPVPILNRQQGPIARAQAAHNVAQKEQRAVVAETEAALQRAIAVSRSRHTAAAHLAQEVFAHLPELRRMAEESYRQGKSNIVDLLDAFRSLKTLRMQYVEQLVGAEHAEVDLLFAAGFSAQSHRGTNP
ncbi:MAG: TolC family protein [Elusimicrobia bacterium]|nr:MAG: TolC family protein [Elusimicrobiota bacterium]